MLKEELLLQMFVKSKERVIKAGSKFSNHDKEYPKQVSLGIMETCWNQLPSDIFYSHILKYCSFDIRRAFHCSPLIRQPFYEEIAKNVKHRYKVYCDFQRILKLF